MTTPPLDEDGVHAPSGPGVDEGLEKQVAELVRQNKTLNDQLKGLIQAERDLYRVQNDLDRQLDRLGALNRFALAASETSDVELVMAQALDFLAEAFTLDSGEAWIRNTDGGWRLAARRASGDTDLGEFDVGRCAEPALALRLDEAALRGEPWLRPYHEGEADLDAEAALVRGEGSTPIVRAHPSRPEPVSLVVMPLAPAADAPPGLLLAMPSTPGQISFHHRLPAPDDLALLGLVQSNVEAAMDHAEQVRRIGQANVELNQAYQRLRELDQLKTRFINTAAHELNTPLTPLRLQMHLLSTTDPVKDPNRFKHAHEVLDRNMQRMEDLVHDILDTARLQSDRLEIRPADIELRDVAEDAVESYEAAAAEAKVALCLEGRAAGRVRADPKRLAQVLYNLLGNALKFTPEGGTVRVVLDETDDTARLRVIDTGTGLSAAQMSRLFQPFSQVHEGEQSLHHGTGLGLYISKGVIEQQDGHIWCDSEGPGHGSTFGFSLPLVRPATPRSSKAGESLDAEQAPKAQGIRS